jgi:hypothetical protein
MADPDVARAYLKEALRQHEINLNDASDRVGRNHAYFQQYTRLISPKPRWLKEEIRKALVEAYPFLEEDRLTPPPLNLRAVRKTKVSSAGDSHDQPQINPPRYGKFVDDPRQLELLVVWDQILPGDRDLAISILRGFARKAGANVA